MDFLPQIQSNVQGLKLKELLRRNVKNKEEGEGEQGMGGKRKRKGRKEKCNLKPEKQIF